MRLTPWILLLMAACRFPYPEAKRPAKPLPDAFSGFRADTTRKKPLPPRKIFFQDALLQAYIDSALKQNFEYRSGQQLVMQRYAGVVEMKGVRSPDLSAVAGAGIRRFGKYTMDGVGNFDTRFSPNLSENQRVPDPLPDFLLGVQSSWEADIWGKLKDRKKAARYRFLSGEMGQRLLETRVVSMVATAYYNLRALESEAAIYEENIQLQAEALEATRIQKETGMANQLAVEIMEAQLLKSRELALRVEQNRVLAQNALLYLCGRFPDAIATQPGTLDQALENLIPNQIPSEWLSQRPDFAQALLDMTAAEAQVEVAKKAFYPNLVLSGSLGLQAFRASLLFDLPASLAMNGLAGLAAPLANRRVLKAQLLQSETEKRLAYIRYEETLVRGFTEVYNALVSLQNVEERINLTSREVDLLKSSVRTSRELFRTGRASYLEVNNAQKNALESQLELVELKRYRQQLRIELYRSLGGGAN